jgi:non-ribosomal peptide synthetase component F
VAGRNRPDLEGLIGSFMNTLPLRLDLSGNPAFRELLDRVRRVVLGAYAHQELPFECMAEDLQTTSPHDRQSALQFLFEVDNAPPGRLRLAGLEVRPLPSERPATTCDLALAVRATEAGLHCGCTYRADLWNARTIGSLLHQYGSLLQQVADDPDRRIGEYSLAMQSR